MNSIRLLLLSVSLFLFMGNNSFAQNKKIAGSLTDQNGKPLEGASVNVKGSNVSTITDKQGKFSITVPATGNSN